MDFLRQYFIEDTALCDDIIDYYNKSSNKTRGGFKNSLGQYVVETDKKQCTEITINITEEVAKQKLFKKYLEQLQLVCNKYVEEFPFSNEYSQWGIIEPINIQYYSPGGDAFKMYHSERTQSKCDRHLVFMTYLNDVTDGGETEFYHQKYKISPEKGKTVIWPSDWTYTHRGLPSLTQEKYIITGWFNYF